MSSHWHVLGPGAMGCLFSQQLIAAGCSITLLQRAAPDTSEALIRVEAGGHTQLLPVHASATSDPGTIERLLVTTKAPAIEAALAAVKHRITNSTHIVLAANGMGFVEPAKALLPANHLYCCTTTEGAYRIGPLHIRHAGRGITRLGSIDGGTVPHWFTDWQTSPLQCHWEEDISAALWHKLAVNCAINPLTALHKCCNGQLNQNRHLREYVKQLCDEIAVVSRARGCDKTALTLHDDVSAVISATAENRSSMLQDIEAGRATEIEFITGYLVREASRLGIDVPANQTLLTQVNALDQ